MAFSSSLLDKAGGQNICGSTPALKWGDGYIKGSENNGRCLGMRSSTAAMSFTMVSAELCTAECCGQ